jgi:lipid A 3-O-deacylase
MSIKTAITFIVLTAVLWSQAVYASEENARKSSTFTLYQENDIYNGTGADGDYTNGTRVTWLSPDLTGNLDDPGLSPLRLALIHALPFSDGPGVIRRLSLSMGQNIYTPEKIEKLQHDNTDRPYAGITYCAVGFHSQNALIMNTWEFTFGIVGPHSYAENMQKAVHRWTNSKYPNGWEDQIKDEPLFNIDYERKWRLSPESGATGFGYDVIPHAGCAVGNSFTALNGGGQIRYGWNLPHDFGTLLVRPSSDTNAPIDDDDPRFNQRFGIFVFTGLDAYACVRDITLDGNTYRPSDRVKKRDPFVAHMTGGLGIITGRFKITYTYAARTNEYSTQKSRERYGSITISYTH